MGNASVHPFDLPARLALAARGLTALIDPDRDGLMYFLGDWRARPPRADHNLWDFGDGSGRHLDALTLADTMAETEKNQIEAWVLRLLGDDGLSWLPVEPGAAPWEAGVLLAEPPRTGEPICEVSWSQRGTLMGLLSRYLRTMDERYLTGAKRLIDGLLAIARRHEDGLYFPEGYYRRGGWRTDRHNLQPCLAEYNAAVLAATARLYEISGYPPARELAAGLVDFTLRHGEGYGPDGEFLVPDDLGSHFHTRSNFALGVLRFGVVDGRSELVEWARASYDQLSRLGTDFGWFPEHIGYRHGEICSTTDMIELALLLGRHVDRRHFADAERFGRNHLLESQWCSLDRLLAAVSALPPAAPAVVDRTRSTTDDVAARQVGAFASRPGITDALHLDAPTMMQCCNAAGARGLYDLWRYAVAETPPAGAHGKVAIHLRFSVQTPTIRVVSHEPTEGRLDITSFAERDVEVRVPEDIGHATAVRPHTDETVLTAVDGYVRFAAHTGEQVELRYPLTERTQHYRVGPAGREDRAHGRWRGETLMSIEPAGRFHPIYNRPPRLQAAAPTGAQLAPIESL